MSNARDESEMKYNYLVNTQGTYPIRLITKAFPNTTGPRAPDHYDTSKRARYSVSPSALVFAECGAQAAFPTGHFISRDCSNLR